MAKAPGRLDIATRSSSNGYATMTTAWTRSFVRLPTCRESIRIARFFGAKSGTSGRTRAACDTPTQPPKACQLALEWWRPRARRSCLNDSSSAECVGGEAHRLSSQPAAGTRATGSTTHGHSWLQPTSWKYTSWLTSYRSRSRHDEVYTLRSEAMAFGESLHPST